MGNGSNRDVVVIGGSAGALEPLKTIVAALPLDLSAAVLVALHLGPNVPSMLSSILTRVGGLPAVVPKEGDPPRPGYIYVASPDCHLELTPEGIKNGHGPRVNGVRPSVDVLFQTAAATFGPRVIGVVLSGGLDDGSAGLEAIRLAGGMTVVQDPGDAMVESMPTNAIRAATPDHVAPASELGRVIVEGVAERAHPRPRKPIGGNGVAVAVGADDVDGVVTGLTCPECHGSIWVHGEPGEVTFSCRVGHSYSPDSFFTIQSENVENALWAAVRSLEEQASLATAMETRAERREDAAGRVRYAERRRQALANAETLRRLLVARD